MQVLLTTAGGLYAASPVGNKESVYGLLNLAFNI